MKSATATAASSVLPLPPNPPLAVKCELSVRQTAATAAHFAPPLKALMAIPQGPRDIRQSQQGPQASNPVRCSERPRGFVSPAAPRAPLQRAAEQQRQQQHMQGLAALGTWGAVKPMPRALPPGRIARPREGGRDQAQDSVLVGTFRILRPGEASTAYELLEERTPGGPLRPCLRP